MWAAGTAGAAAAVTFWRIVGPGYTWLTAATVAALGSGVWFFDADVVVGISVVLSIGAIFVARRPRFSAALLAGATGGLLWFSIRSGAPLLSITGSVALGGITAEMLLGHWYLISPQMPRWALRRLDIAGAVGMALDALALIVAGALAAVTGVGGLVFGILVGMSILLMVAVWFSLKEPSYPGVMAATGLSYLAVLTSLGATALGRTLLDGSSGFLPFE